MVFRRLLTLAAAGFVAACATHESATDPTRDLPGGGADDEIVVPAVPEDSVHLALASVRLAVCAPTAVESLTVRVGARGDSLAVGEASLVVPPGALAREVAITMVVGEDSLAGVRLEPHGLVFREGREARLRLDYGDCADALASERPKRVVYLDAAGAIAEAPASVDHRRGRLAEGVIAHFSKYAVAY